MRARERFLQLPAHRKRIEAKYYGVIVFHRLVTKTTSRRQRMFGSLFVLRQVKSQSMRENCLEFMACDKDDGSVPIFAN